MLLRSSQNNVMPCWSLLWCRVGGERDSPCAVAIQQRCILVFGGGEETPCKGVTLAGKCAAVQRHILLWGKVRNWKVSAGSWVIGTCYYCVPPPPFNNLFIEIPLLQSSLRSCKTCFKKKKKRHFYSHQVCVPTFLCFYKGERALVSSRSLLVSCHGCPWGGGKCPGHPWKEM